MAGSKAKRERRERWLRLKHDPEFIDDILERVATGDSLLQLAAEYDVAYSTLASFLAGVPGTSGATASQDILERYARARQSRAGYNVARIEAMAEKIERGQLDPKAGKVAIDTRQWLAARLDPHLWGDKTRIDHHHQGSVSMHLEAIKQLVGQDAASTTPERAIEHDPADDAVWWPVDDDKAETAAETPDGGPVDGEELL